MEVAVTMVAKEMAVAGLGSVEIVEGMGMGVRGHEDRRGKD
jgi:hypothetical protein